jgi:predicted DNA binding CopG/RHH family protein
MADKTRPKHLEYLDDEEQQLIESLERDEWDPITDRETAVSQAIAVAQATLKKDRRMNVRISERDLKGLKARAAEEGIPYQTLVTMVLHKYVAGRFVEKTTINN